MWGGDGDRGVEKEPESEQTTLLTDGGREQSPEATYQCPTCGKRGARPLGPSWIKAYIEGSGFFGAFCSANCYEGHWLTNSTDEEQTRLGEITASTT